MTTTVGTGRHDQQQTGSAANEPDRRQGSRLGPETTSEAQGPARNLPEPTRLVRTRIRRESIEMIWWTAAFAGEAMFAGMVLWRVRSPRTFRRWISAPLRARYLTWYRYRLRWSRRMTAARLALTTADGVTRVPRLLSVRIGDTADRVRVRMLDGHCPADYENRTTHLATAFGVPGCDAAIVGPGTVEIVLYQQVSPDSAVLLDDLKDVA
ncbi:hypothetical protein ACWEO2_43925 [Nocardia sp. NPDC004278]